VHGGERHGDPGRPALLRNGSSPEPGVLVELGFPRLAGTGVTRIKVETGGLA
jgi:hypothetical protein